MKKKSQNIRRTARGTSRKTIVASKTHPLPLRTKIGETVIRQEVAKVIADYTAACERADAAGKLSFLADVPEFRCADLDGTLHDYVGNRTAVTDLLAGLAAIKIRIPKPEIIPLGADAAFVIGHGPVELVQKEGTTIRLDPFNVTFLLKRIGGAWKIVCQHDSSPPPRPVTITAPGKPPADVAAEVVKAFNEHDAAALARLYAQDQVTVLPGLPAPLRGRKAKEEMVSGFFRAFPNLKLDLPLILAKGKIAETWFGYNLLDMLEPLGFTLAPPNVPSAQRK